MDILRKDWDMELEMASGYYALALTGIMDTEDGFFSLSEALHTIDEQMKKDRERCCGRRIYQNRR